MHTMCEGMLTLSTQNYQNQSMIVETAACQSWLVFETQYIRAAKYDIRIPCETQLFNLFIATAM